MQCVNTYIYVQYNIIQYVLLDLPSPEYDEVELLIDGGTTFKVGTTAVIRCHYTGLIALSPPHFSINGRFYNSDNLKMALPRYQHAYNSGIEGDVLWANYSLTLPSVQISDNGTSYQCSVDPIDLLRRYHSNTVILMVVGKCIICQFGIMVAL